MRDEKIGLKIEEYKKALSTIDYYGYVTEIEKSELIKNCAALVFPSYVEGFGIPSLEALFLDKSIIVSNIAVFKEILGDCANYFTLHFHDNDSSIDSLTEKLFNYVPVDKEKVSTLKSKYSSQVLVKNLVGFLEQNKYNYNVPKRKFSIKNIFQFPNINDKSNGIDV
jgi:glycosyltransferase involved in cell wall biosynthesis